MKTSISIDPVLWEEAKKTAALRGITVTAFLEELIKKELEPGFLKSAWFRAVKSGRNWLWKS